MPLMYIRASTQHDKRLTTKKRSYTTYRLVESYRNQDGKVRQHTLFNLGCHFDFPKTQWKLLADRIEEIQRGQGSLFTVNSTLEQEAQRIAKCVTQQKGSITSKKKLPVQTEQTTDHQHVDLNSVDHGDIRKIGAEHVGYSAAKQLKLDEILSTVGLSNTHVDLALATIISRLVHPGSELNTHRYLREQSALDELLETNFTQLPLKNLYAISDILLKNKTKIEKALYQREKDLFTLEEVVTLYDITNTYFEGHCALNPKGQYGRSKEKRSDRRLVSLGMVLDASGFPKRSDIFPGNVVEGQTMEAMLKTLEPSDKATIVMDAGIATQKNIDWLTEAGYEYIVVSRKRTVPPLNEEDAVIVKEGRHNKVTATLVKNEETKELELYCHSEAKAAKTNQMRSKAGVRFETELQKLADGLTKKSGTKKVEKVIERLGRLKEKYKTVSFFYDITLEPDTENKKVIAVSWVKNEEVQGAKQPGIYCLRTNKTNLNEKEFWHIYTMLTEIEAAFRSLKSELGLRPVYHQTEKRIDAHIFISLLAYHLLHTIRYQLKRHNINESWQTLREVLETQCRITTTIKLTDGRAVKIRKTSSPDTNQARIYKTLKMASHPGETVKVYT